MDLTKKFSGFKNAERPSVGLALVFDISGFTNFFNKPDIQDYITDYINKIIDCVEICIWGGKSFWLEDKQHIDKLKLVPVMRKFLGDGMLYVWENDENDSFSRGNFKMSLLNRLWSVQKYFEEINNSLYDHMPTGDLPVAVKFGVAQGTVYKLTENDGTIDYIGPCINLASRLVKYCPAINFIASTRVKLPIDYLKSNGYMRVIAIELRSFEKEIVIVEMDDYKLVSDYDKKKTFSRTT
jgi:class 3 adenylate cyclase